LPELNKKYNETIKKVAEENFNEIADYFQNIESFEHFTLSFMITFADKY